MSSNLETSVRILLAIVGFVGAVIAPWWVPLACIVLLCLRFAAWEALAIGLFMDLLYLPHGAHFSVPLYTLFAIAAVWLMQPMRAQFLL